MSRPTSRVLIGVAVVAVLIAAGAFWWSSGRGTGSDSADSRTLTAGEVTVVVTPLAMDASGARFRVVLDTHSVELDLDVAAAAQLSVADRDAGPGAWAGAPAGGHHREGTLTFDTSVAAGDTVQLRLTGLPQEVVTSWVAAG